MLKGLTLTELAQRIESLKTQKKDFIADTGDQVSMIVANPEGSTTAQPMLAIEDHGQYPVRDLAHSQIAQRVGIPAIYYDRMRSEAPQLLADNVNNWFRAAPEKRLIRTLSGNTRAFLSNAYQRVENEEIAEVALPILLNTPGIKVVSCEVTERRLYIKAVSTMLSAEVKGSKRVGDIVESGVAISNSEVGHGSVSVS